MKIIISSGGKTINDFVDVRFGRCPFFLVVYLEGDRIKSTEYVANQGALQAHGAGIVAAQQVANIKPDAVITGNLGPNSSMVLSQVGIPVYQAAGTAKQAVDDFISGKLRPILAPTRHGHGETAQTNALSYSNNHSHQKDMVLLVPLRENNSYDSAVAEHFGHAPFFGIYKGDNLNIIENTLDHSSEKPPAQQIIEQIQPSLVFAKSIGNRAKSVFLSNNIVVKTGPYNTVREIIDNLSALEDLH